MSTSLSPVTKCARPGCEHPRYRHITRQDGTERCTGAIAGTSTCPCSSFKAPSPVRARA